MAQSVKFGFGQQKRKKILLLCGAVQRLKGSMAKEKSSAQTQWRVPEGKTPVCTSQHLSQGTPSKTNGQTDVSLL